MQGTTETLEHEDVIEAESPGKAGAMVAADKSKKLPISKKEPTPLGLIQMGLQMGVDIDYLQKLMDLQERHEANEAKKAFNKAFAAFKTETLEILKNKQVTDGPLKGKSYAELFSVVDVVVPAMAKYGLSHTWDITKDEPTWIEVACVISHEQGWSKTVKLGGPPDTGGAKNAIQARVSTVSYLERATLKAACGVAERGEDQDGNASGKAQVGEFDSKLTTKAADWIAAIYGCESKTNLEDTFQEGFADLGDADGYGRNQLIKARDNKKKLINQAQGS